MLSVMLWVGGFDRMRSILCSTLSSISVMFISSLSTFILKSLTLLIELVSLSLVMVLLISGVFVILSIVVAVLLFTVKFESLTLSSSLFVGNMNINEKNMTVNKSRSCRKDNFFNRLTTMHSKHVMAAVIRKSASQTIRMNNSMNIRMMFLEWVLSSSL